MPRAKPSKVREAKPAPVVCDEVRIEPRDSFEITGIPALPELTPQQLIDALDVMDSTPPVHSEGCRRRMAVSGHCSCIEREPPSMPPDSLPLGASPVVYLTPEALVERYPVPGDLQVGPGVVPELASTDVAYPRAENETEPTQMSRPEPSPEAMADRMRERQAVLDADPQVVEWEESERIRRRLDEDPELRGFVARYLSGIHGITQANGGQEPIAFVLEPLWVERLGKMAQAADCSPNDYLRTLLVRAWCALPRAQRL